MATRNAPNIFALLTASTSDAEMLHHLKNPETAIGFGLEHLDPVELAEFLRAWKDDADLSPFLEAWRIDLQAARGDWSGHPNANEQ